MNSASVFVFQNTHQGFKTQKKDVNMYCKTQISVCKHKSELFTENCICDLSKHSFAFSCFYYFGVPVGFVFYSFAFPKHVLGFTKHKAEKYSSVFGNTNQVFHQNPDLFFPSLTIFGLNLCFGFWFVFCRICVLIPDLCFSWFVF